MSQQHLIVENFGQIKKADVHFGDLTICVGPQATGKTVFLELFNLLIDNKFIRQELQQAGVFWENERERFFDVYFGEGMRQLWKDETRIMFNGKESSLEYKVTKRKNGNKTEEEPEICFNIPAQRVLAIDSGWPRGFRDFSSGDPFLIRRFSDRLRILMEEEFTAAKGKLFPQDRRLRKEFRNSLSADIFGGFELNVETVQNQRRWVLNKEEDSANSLPAMVWSAGQREFVPLLVSLYWLLPRTKTAKKELIDWVVIEEPETGLHPKAISTTLVLIMDLLKRGYRVCLSTHSPHILQMIWGIRHIKKLAEKKRSSKDQFCLDSFLKLFDLTPDANLRTWASYIIPKDIGVYYFDQGGNTHDISALDPGSDDKAMSGWGGIMEKSGKICDIVANVVNKGDLWQG